ncbi:MAG: YncE family protein, partial [Thermoplasmata archaeon]
MPSASLSNGTPYVAYTLNLLNGSLLAQNAPYPACSLPTPAPYVVHFPAGPTDAIDLPALHELYVACPTGNLLVVNDTTGALIATAVVGIGPDAIIAQDVGGVAFLYIANAGTFNISVVSTVTNHVVQTIGLPVGAAPAGLAFGPGGSNLYVTDSGLATVSVVEMPSGRLVETIPVGVDPTGIAFDPFDGFLYETNRQSDTVGIVAPRTNTLVGTLPTG